MKPVSRPDQKIDTLIENEKLPNRSIEMEKLGLGEYLHIIGESNTREESSLGIGTSPIA